MFLSIQVNFYQIIIIINVSIHLNVIKNVVTLFILFFAGSSIPIRHISLRALFPNTDAYMTYEGSTTHPGCWESTVWIILNKPIYITKQEVSYYSNFSKKNYCKY